MALPRDRSAYVKDLTGMWRWATNPTPSGTNPFARVMTPIGRIDGNTRIPQAQAPGQRANTQN